MNRKARAVTLRSLARQEQFFSFSSKGATGFTECSCLFSISINAGVSYMISGLLACLAIWSSVLSSICWKSHEGHLVSSSLSQDGPCHYSWLSMRASAETRLVGKSAGFWVLVTYLNLMSLCDFISFSLFWTKTGSGLWLFIQRRTHFESVHSTRSVTVNCSCSIT